MFVEKVKTVVFVLEVDAVFECGSRTVVVSAFGGASGTGAVRCAERDAEAHPNVVRVRDGRGNRLFAPRAAARREGRADDQGEKGETAYDSVRRHNR